MLNDVVVDTNVWMHAGNPNERRFQEALTFVTELMNSSTRLALDGESLDEDGLPTPSRILDEYERKFLGGPPGTGANVLAYLISQGRLKRVTLRTTEYLKRWTVQHIGKSTDRPFLIVAVNSKSKMLVTHDSQDFSDALRAQARTEFGVVIGVAADGTAALRAA